MVIIITFVNGCVAIVINNLDAQVALIKTRLIA